MVAPSQNGIRRAQVEGVMYHSHREERIMKMTTIGIDLAKRVFQIPGVESHGKVALKKQLKRAQMLTFFANREPCLIGMEACGSAHDWARKLSA